MNYQTDLTVLRLYSKQERITLSEMSVQLGMSNNTLSRYVTGVRKPDLPSLLHLCNTLRLSVSAFIHHSYVVPDRVEVWPPSEFHPISFRADAIERYRQEHSLTRVAMLQAIRKACSVNIDPSTYTRMTEGCRIGLDLPLGFLNTYGLSLSYLFDDPQLSPHTMPVNDDYLLVNRNELSSLRLQLRQLAAENERLKQAYENLRAQISLPSVPDVSAPCSPRSDASGPLTELVSNLRKLLSDFDEKWNIGVTPPPPAR